MNHDRPITDNDDADIMRVDDTELTVRPDLDRRRRTARRACSTGSRPRACTSASSPRSAGRRAPRCSASPTSTTAAGTPWWPSTATRSWPWPATTARSGQPPRPRSPSRSRTPGSTGASASAWPPARRPGHRPGLRHVRRDDAPRQPGRARPRAQARPRRRPCAGRAASTKPTLPLVARADDRASSRDASVRLAVARRAIGRAGTRTASPDHVSSTAHTLLSTSPCASPSSRTMPSRRSVATHAVRFGHAIHKPPAGAIARANPSKRRSSSARRVAKNSTTSCAPRACVRSRTPSGNGFELASRSPSGARTSASRAPGLMPSFWGRGVPEYPATSRSQSRLNRAVNQGGSPTRQRANCGTVAAITPTPARHNKSAGHDRDRRRERGSRPAPPSKSPRRGPPVTTKMFNDASRPRRPSGTVSCCTVLRNTAEMTSAPPAIARNAEREPEVVSHQPERGDRRAPHHDRDEDREAEPADPADPARGRARRRAPRTPARANSRPSTAGARGGTAGRRAPGTAPGASRRPSRRCRR